MQSQSYLITSTSTNLIKELRNYCWDSDAQGRSMNNPIGTDHAIDSWRYHEMMALGIKSNYGVYSIK